MRIKTSGQSARPTAKTAKGQINCSAAVSAASEAIKGKTWGWVSLPLREYPKCRGWVSLPSRCLTFKPLVPVIVLMLVMGLGSCRDRATVLTPPPTALGGTLNSRDAEHHPRLSYDGRYLVFSSDRRNQRQVYLYDVQRRQVIPLPGLNTPGTFIGQPDISADGRYIVYVSEQYGKPDVFLYDRQAFRSEVLTRDFKGELRQPTISGNGRIVAFESNRTGEWNIEIIDRGNIAPSLPQNQQPDNVPSAGEE